MGRTGQEQAPMKSITHFNKQTDDTSARTDMPLVYSDLRARAKAHEINPR